MCTHLVLRDYAKCAKIRRSPFGAESRVSTFRTLGPYLRARGTKANAHTPWSVYPTAWELGWATLTLQQSHTALPTPYSARSNCGSGVVRVVCTPSSAARAGMGHWEQCLHTPGMAGHCLVTLGDHTHTTTTTFGAANTVFDRVRIAVRG